MWKIKEVIEEATSPDKRYLACLYSYISNNMIRNIVNITDTKAGLLRKVVKRNHKKIDLGEFVSKTPGKEIIINSLENFRFDEDNKLYIDTSTHNIDHKGGFFTLSDKKVKEVDINALFGYD